MVIVTGPGRSGTSFMTKLLYYLYNHNPSSNSEVVFNSKMDAGYEDQKITFFNKKWDKGNIKESVNFFNKNLNYFKTQNILKDPRFYYNNNLHFIQKYFPNLKIVWMDRNYEEIYQSALNLFNKSIVDSGTWIYQSQKDYNIQKEYFKFYLKKYNISYLKVNYSNLEKFKPQIFNFCYTQIKYLELSHFNNIWDTILKK